VNSLCDYSVQIVQFLAVQIYVCFLAM